MFVFYLLIFLISFLIGTAVASIFEDRARIYKFFKVRWMRRLGRNCSNCKYKLLKCTLGSDRCHCPTDTVYNPCTGETIVMSNWTNTTVGTKKCKWAPKDE